MRTYWHKVDRDWKFVCEDSNDFPEDKETLADVAIWTTPLTEAEIKALKGGARPITVAKEKLKTYHPLEGNECQGCSPWRISQSPATIITMIGKDTSTSAPSS